MGGGDLAGLRKAMVHKGGGRLKAVLQLRKKKQGGIERKRKEMVPKKDEEEGGRGRQRRTV